jgi:hypothetical protein
MKVARILALIGGALLLLIAAPCALRRPSNARDWSIDQAVLPTATFNGPLVTLHDVRNFTYRTESDFTPGYYEKTVDLRKLDSAWFLVEPFGNWNGPAHTFVSFGFDGGRDFVAISVEIRKEKGESFSALKGLFRNYEVMYVVGDERDLVKLRTNFRHDSVYLYPIHTTPERMRRMFVEMVEKANQLSRKPEFYNTVTNNCTTSLADHVNRIVPHRIPLSIALVLPGYSDRLAYRLGLIDTKLPFEGARRRYRINDRARKFTDDPQFSQHIRE